MAGYLTDKQKAGYSKPFQKLHETFARPVIVWKTPDRVVISSDSNYNFLYNDQESIEVNYTPISGTFNCRIQWQDPTKSMGWPEIKEDVRGNICRIKAKKDFVDFIENAEKIEIDGKTVQSLGTNRPHGLFDIDFYTMFFKESQ